jgi:hypothetical protein
MTALKMRLEARKGKRAAKRELKKNADKAFKEVIADLQIYAKQGKTITPNTYTFSSWEIRNEVASRLINRGYKVEYVWEQNKLHNISWAK